MSLITSALRTRRRDSGSPTSTAGQVELPAGAATEVSEASGACELCTAATADAPASAHALARRNEAGMTTAEYAVGTIAACTFAMVLLAVVKSDQVKGALGSVIAAALGLGS